ITMQAYARADQYYLHDVKLADPLADNNNKTVARAVAAAALEWRYPFVKELGAGNTSLVIAPVAQLVMAPRGGNSRQIPDEDSGSFEFDETNLFSITQLPGYDRWSGGPRVNAGVSATALMPSGSVALQLGQEYRWTPDPVFAAGSGL